MGRLRETIESARQSKGAALVVFLMAGDPDLETSLEVLAHLEEWGVDVVELGVPFSDPIADGPVIQRASERALASGTTLFNVLELVQALRRRSGIPLVLFTYTNPVLQVGLGRFPALAKGAGVDGALVLDLPPEEADGYLEACRDADLETVFLVAPTSTDERIRRAARASSGFVYCVSRTGVTGEQREVEKEAEGLVGRIRRLTELPVAVGFGVSRPEHVQQIARYADAVVVGSAIVRSLEESPRAEVLSRVKGRIHELLKGLR
ncbi:MAG: tryptophan synthase subunit alpha [candidate division KSB1 bacterium]|nr:tryptophan synthase subunit alpha [candidate division KSB1 bacterium]